MNEEFHGTAPWLAALLRKRLAEPPPTRIQLLVGPRQVGKTTLLLGLHKELGARSWYASADAPESALPGWADRVWDEAARRAQAGPAVLLLDEVQALPDWSAWLKARFDAALRASLPLHVVATGSSSLRLGAGARESMAGRFERSVLHQWGARDLARILGVPGAEAPYRLVSRGGYPGAVRLWDEPERWAAYVRDAIREPAIGRDILQLEPVRKPALLRQVFALAAAHPAEILSLEKIAGSLSDAGTLETIAHYLQLLAEAFLVAPLQKYAAGAVRRRRSPPKLVMLDNALLDASPGGNPPDPDDPARWGRWVENACLAHAIHRGQEVHYWREEPLEVDGVLAGSWGRWLVEVKTGHYGAADLRALARAAGRFRDFRPVVFCDPGREDAARAAGMEAVAWPEVLMDAWPRTA